MKGKIVSTLYVPLQPPYQVIKYDKDVAMQIGTLIVTVQKESEDSTSDYQIETHSHPVVAYENKACDEMANSQLTSHNFLEGAVWNNVEVRDVTTICLTGATLTWQDFLDALEHENFITGYRKAPDVDIYWNLIKLGVKVLPPTERTCSVCLTLKVQIEECGISLHDAALFTVCRELMYAVQSPSPYSAKRNQRFASDENNRPRMAEPLAEELSYDDSLDDIFDERVRGQKVKKALDRLTFKKTGRVEWFVAYKVFLHLKWIKEGCEQKEFLKWVNLQYHCGWDKEHHFVFSRDVNKSLRDNDISCWKTIRNNEYTKGEKYYNFAILLRTTFQQVIVNDRVLLKEQIQDFLIGKNRDRQEFMVNPANLINWGK